MVTSHGLCRVTSGRPGEYLSHKQERIVSPQFTPLPLPLGFNMWSSDSMPPVTHWYACPPHQYIPQAGSSGWVTWGHSNRRNLFASCPFEIECSLTMSSSDRPILPQRTSRRNFRPRKSVCSLIVRLVDFSWQQNVHSIHEHRTGLAGTQSIATTPFHPYWAYHAQVMEQPPAGPFETTADAEKSQDNAPVSNF